MEPALKIYMAGYAAALGLAAWLAVRERRCLSLLSRTYWRLLSARWKWLTFTIATLGFVGIAPYSGDPTWDYADAAFMSLLTFATAPWAIGTLYRWGHGQACPSHAYIALCLWLFSASWSYDLYILYRDGNYPITWLANLFASSVLYVAAGMLWNLEWRPERGVIFAFMDQHWPRPAPAGSGFRRIFGYALPFMLLVAACAGYFFW